MSEKNDGRLKTYQVNLYGCVQVTFAVDVEAWNPSEATHRLKRLIEDANNGSAEDGDPFMQIVANCCMGIDPRVDPSEFHVDDADIYDEDSIEEASWPPNMLPSHLK